MVNFEITQLQSTVVGKRWAPGFVNSVLALAYHICLALPAAFTQPRARLLAKSTVLAQHNKTYSSTGPGCNLHSWAYKFPCCFDSEERNPSCMWDKLREFSREMGPAVIGKVRVDTSDNDAFKTTFN